MFAMASSFTLAMYPWVYKAQYQDDGSWTETYDEKPHKSPTEEAALPPKSGGRSRGRGTPSPSCRS